MLLYPIYYLAIRNKKTLPEVIFSLYKSNSNPRTRAFLSCSEDVDLIIENKTRASSLNDIRKRKFTVMYFLAQLCEKPEQRVWTD